MSGCTFVPVVGRRTDPLFLAKRRRRYFLLRAIVALRRRSQSPVPVLEWGKWHFDPADYPLLRQIQAGQGEILAQSFMGETRFYLDYLKLDTLDACTFPDPEEAIVFIGLTRFLVHELLKLTGILAASIEVQTIIGAPASPVGTMDVADALFFLTLQFVIAHEVGHYVCGHVVDRALHFEFSGPAHRPVNLRRHADEVDADAYAILELCRNLLDGDSGSAIVELLPPGGIYGDDQLAALLVISVTAIFLLHLSQPRRDLNLAKDKHPPLAYRYHLVIEIIQHWLKSHDKSAAAVTGEGLHAIIQAVSDALPTDLRPRWNAQIDVMESPAGKAYLDALDQMIRTRLGNASEEGSET